MAMQAKGPGAGWSWLMAGFTVARSHPGRIFGTAALLAACLALPALLEFAARAGGAAVLAALGVLTLVSGLLYPILYGGFMRVLDATRNDRPSSALAIFDAFRPGRGGLRLLLFGVCMLVTYLVFFAIVLSTVGRGVGAWYLHALAQPMAAAQPHVMPALPAGFGSTFALALVFFLFYGGALAVGTGQVALRGRSPWAGYLDGIAGAFKNVLPLVVLAICGFIAMIVVSIILVIVAAILFLLGHLAGAAAGYVLMGILYVAFLLCAVAFMMGVNYAIWHDVADAASNHPVDLPVSSVQG